MDLVDSAFRLHLWPVIAASVAAFVIGGLWYSPMLFARSWMRYVGTTEERLQQDSQVRIFGVAFLLTAVIAIVLDLLIPDTATASGGALLAAVAGTGFAAATLGVTFTFERRPPGLLLIDCGYHLATFIVMGSIIGGLQ